MRSLHQSYVLEHGKPQQETMCRGSFYGQCSWPRNHKLAINSSFFLSFPSSTHNPFPLLILPQLFSPTWPDPCFLPCRAPATRDTHRAMAPPRPHAPSGLDVVPKPALTRRVGPAGDNPVLTRHEAQEISGYMRMMLRPDSERMLDFAWIEIRSDADRKQAISVLSSLFFCPGLTIVPVRLLTYPVRGRRWNCIRCSLDPSRCPRTLDMISIPFDWACKAKEIVTFIQETMGRTVHYCEWRWVCRFIPVLCCRELNRERGRD